MVNARGCVVLLSLSVAACDPLVALEETSGGTEGSTGALGSTGGSGPGTPPGTVPPNPSTTAPTGCVPGSYDECTCPGGGYGEQLCGTDGVFRPCECYGDDLTWGTSGSSGWWGTSGSSGWWGSSSGDSWGSSSSGDSWGSSSGSSSGGGEWTNPPLPELPPGEDCLGSDLPCVGDFEAGSDAVLESIGVCSRVEGALFVHDVSSVDPLGCLQQVDGYFGIVDTSATDLSGLSALTIAGGLFLFGNEQLTNINPAVLSSTDEFYIHDNPVLSSLDLPSLVEVSVLFEAFNNPMLPECEIEEVSLQASLGGLSCEGNLTDMCAGLCN